MNKHTLPRPAWDLIELVCCGLHGKTVSAQRLADMDMKCLFALAQAQSLAALAAFALKGQLNQQDLRPWREAEEKSLRKNLLLDLERRRICGWMEQNGIWHMSLKGSVLKDLYPRMEMRQMSDQDILYDGAFRKELRRYMLEQGYEPDSFRDTHHDVYYKPPLYNIELHHKLFERCCDLRLVDYYRDVKQRLIPDSPDSLSFHFTDEDFYIYMTAHAYKHYRDKGVGLRACVDAWVYGQAKGSAMDWGYVQGECARLGIADYERNCRTLAGKLFSGEPVERLSPQELELLRFSFESGTHGTEDGSIRHALKQLQGSDGPVTGRTKGHYLLKRLFPDVQWMKQKSKMVRRYPWTLPLAWGIRLCRGVFVKGGHTAAELRYVMNTEET